MDALRTLNLWGGQPLPLSASCWHDGVLSVRLSGAEAAVQAAVRSLGGERIEDATEFWTCLREQRHAFFEQPGSLWRLSMPSAASAIVLRGAQLIEWGGAQRWLKLDADASGTYGIRRAVEAAGGHATLFRGGVKALGVFHPLPHALAKINQRMKDAFDPSNIFNPGRMY